jgi:hypothetical protein
MDEDLQARFVAMSDDEMADLGAQYASLTDDAQALVREEFKRRNLEIPDAADDQAPDALLGVKTIRQYRDQAEAILARSALESAGIACFLRDENTIRNRYQRMSLYLAKRIIVSRSVPGAAHSIADRAILMQR